MQFISSSNKENKHWNCFGIDWNGLVRGSRAVLTWHHLHLAEGNIRVLNIDSKIIGDFNLFWIQQPFWKHDWFYCKRFCPGWFLRLFQNSCMGIKGDVAHNVVFSDGDFSSSSLATCNSSFLSQFNAFLKFFGSNSSPDTVSAKKSSGLACLEEHPSLSALSALQFHSNGKLRNKET